MKKVLITGSNRGLGFELCRFLLRSAPEFGCIILTSRNPDLGAQAISSLGPSPRLDYCQLDVTNLQSISQAKQYVLEKHGHLDVLVNNSAIYDKSSVSPILKIPSHLATNFYGVKNMAEAFMPLLEPNGHIVNFSSKMGRTEFLGNSELAQRFLDKDLTIDGIMKIAEEFKQVGEDWYAKGWRLEGYGVYTVTKALVNAYTRVLAKNLKDQGSKIRVNAISPGWVRTDMGGSEASLSVEEGVVMPAVVTRDTSIVTGKYWSFDDPS